MYIIRKNKKEEERYFYFISFPFLPSFLPSFFSSVLHLSPLRPPSSVLLPPSYPLYYKGTV